MVELIEGPRTRRWGRATSHLVRLLVVNDKPFRQVDMAERLGVSQARVSQMLHSVLHESMNSDAEARRKQLVELYLWHHIPEITGETTWFGLEDQEIGAERVVELLRSENHPVVVSADVAPDFLAPWRSPALTVVYTDADTDTDTDLRKVGLVPSTARGDASLILRAVSDPSLLEPWVSPMTPIPLAHPLQQIWDLRDLGGEDRAEAAERLESWLVHQ
jgi:hypothetical protein